MQGRLLCFTVLHKAGRDLSPALVQFHRHRESPDAAAQTHYGGVSEKTERTAWGFLARTRHLPADWSHTHDLGVDELYLRARAYKTCG